MNKATAYGDVTVVLDGKDYTVRTGNLELRKAEELFAVKGVLACLLAANESITNGIRFYRIALSRKHPSLTEDEVADLRDYQPSDGGPTLEAAVEEAVKFAYPKLFEPEDGGTADPNATAAPSSELKTS